MWKFSLLDVSWLGKLIKSGADMSSLIHIDNTKKDILVIGKGLADGLDNKLTAEKECSINSTEQKNTFCLSWHYNWVNSCIFVNAFEMYEFSFLNRKKNAAPSCLGNNSKDVSVDIMKKTGLYGFVHDFSVDYDVLMLMIF